MIVGIFNGMGLLSVFGIISCVTVLWYLLICGGLYYVLYLSTKKDSVRQWKTQMEYPKEGTVLKELWDGCVSSIPAAMNFSLSIWLSNQGLNQLYGNFAELSIGWHIISMITLWAITEIFEWWFHWMAHNNDTLWEIHKKHHLFPNPTPFAVLSDHPLDMWVKSSPILWIPFLFPIWDVMLFGVFGFINFFYGVYLHGGFEFPFLPSRFSTYLISSWHHNIHHSLGRKGKNFGFFTRFMDITFGTMYNPSDRANDLKKRE
jgi:lathosterol oxidase